MQNYRFRTGGGRSCKFQSPAVRTGSRLVPSIPLGGGGVPAIVILCRSQAPAGRPVI